MKIYQLSRRRLSPLFELVFFTALAALFTLFTIMLFAFGAADDLQDGWHTCWLFLGTALILWYEVFDALRRLLQVERTKTKWLLAESLIDLIVTCILSYCAVMLAMKGKYAGTSLYFSIFILGGFYFLYLFLKTLRALVRS